MELNKTKAIAGVPPPGPYSWYNYFYQHTSINKQYKQKRKLYFDVDFSYCWLNLEVSWYSLEQYIGCIIRQAFNYCCSLLQVWLEAEMQALIWDWKPKKYEKF